MPAGRYFSRRGGYTAAATACLITACALLAMTPQPQPPPAPPSTATHHASATTSAAMPGGVALPPSEPTEITAPKIGLRATVDRVALADDGSVGLPTNVLHAGWYTGSVTPGQVGNAIIVGHVDSLDGPAVFYGLGAIRKGFTITVARRDGRTAHFTVTGLDVWPKDAFPSDRVYGPSPRPTLRLITCTGWDRRKHAYRSNLVITAALTGPSPTR